MGQSAKFKKRPTKVQKTIAKKSAPTKPKEIPKKSGSDNSSETIIAKPTPFSAPVTQDLAASSSDKLRSKSKRLGKKLVGKFGEEKDEKPKKDYVDLLFK
ncbi:hypothetical protein HK098_007246 [Nowakowskiella sp. JEL0407]|nr:hypothetical protein HK098_007246 [Nowakowskiella sp. JEL0407]